MVGGAIGNAADVSNTQQTRSGLCNRLSAGWRSSGNGPATTPRHDACLDARGYVK
jgi:hypothetical protein